MDSDISYRVISMCIWLVIRTSAIPCSSSNSTTEVVQICSASYHISNQILLNVSTRDICYCNFSAKLHAYEKVTTNFTTDYKKSDKCDIWVQFVLNHEIRWNVPCDNERLTYPYYSNESILIKSLETDLNGDAEKDLCIELKLMSKQPFVLECGNWSEAIQTSMTSTIAHTSRYTSTSDVIQNSKGNDNGSTSVYPVVGGTLGALLLVLLLTFVLIVYRRNTADRNNELQTKRSQEQVNQSFDDDELKYNTFYQSASLNGMDSQDTKNKSEDNESGPIYENSYVDTTLNISRQNKTQFVEVNSNKLKKKLSKKPAHLQQNVIDSDVNVKYDDAVEHIIAPGGAGCEYALVNKTGNQQVSDRKSISYEIRKNDAVESMNLCRKTLSDEIKGEKKTGPINDKMRSLHYAEVDFQQNF